MCGVCKSCSDVRAKINEWGVLGIVLCAGAFAIPASHWPQCAVYPLMHISASISCAIAAYRGSKSWLLLSAITGLLSAQAILATVIEC
jgi:hypothetical protein